jgi:hypothetical protein
MQTANFILGRLKDDLRAIRKFREVVNMGKAEGELRISFHAQSTLGPALLKLGKESEVVEIRDEMEEMIPLADLHVGSEAMFLQELFEKRIDLDRVAHLAALLAPVAHGGWQERLIVLSIEAAGRL